MSASDFAFMMGVTAGVNVALLFLPFALVIFLAFVAVNVRESRKDT